MVRRWWLSVLVLVCGGLITWSFWDAPAVALAGGLVYLVGAWITSPLLAPNRRSWAAASVRSAEDGRPVIYWRPGCQYCLRLRMRLGRLAGQAHWVDIWGDPEAAAAVREITGGNETVPTVVTRDDARVNPDPEWVRGLLSAS
jgi:mycoredoxin